MIYKLKDLIKIKYGKNQKKVECEAGCYPIIGTGGIIGKAKEYLYDKPSVLIGRKGTIDKVRYIDEPFWTIDTLFYTEINEKIVLPKYLYYKLSMINFKNYNEGTTIPSLRTETLYEIEVDIGDMTIQKQIVKILSKLEDKIRLNTHTNDNLLEIANELLKKDFKEADDIEVLSNVIRFVKGKKPNKISKFKQENYEKYLTIACLNSQELNYADKDKMLIADNDLLMVMDGASSGDVYYSDYGIVGSTLARVDITNNQYISEFIYFALKHYKNLVHSKNTGSAIPHTDKVFVGTLEVPKINIEQQERYKTLLTKIQKNDQENEILKKLRDTLLPKLMDGEIDLDKVEI